MAIERFEFYDMGVDFDNGKRIESVMRKVMVPEDQQIFEVTLRNKQGSKSSIENLTQNQVTVRDLN